MTGRRSLKRRRSRYRKLGKGVGDFDLGGALDHLHQSIQDFRPDIQGWTKDLDENTDALKHQLDALNNAKSAAGEGEGGAAPGDIGHIAPPATTSETPSDGGSDGTEPGGEPGADSGGAGDNGDTGSETETAPEERPGSYMPKPPPNHGVGGPQHVQMAGWHPRVEQVDSHGQYTETGGGAPKNPGERKIPGEHHGEHGGQHHPQRVGTTPQQDREHTRRLEDLGDRIDDATDNIGDLSQQQKTDSGKLAHDKALRDSYIEGSLAWINENKIVIADQKELHRITKELNRTLRERQRAEEDIQGENEKYSEEQHAKHGGKGEGSSPAEDFGRSFLSGLMSDLGLGGIFGKSPLDWGLPKLAEGIVGAFTGGDSGGEGSSGGGSGSGGGGGLGGLLSHLFNPGAADSSSSAGHPQASPFIFGTRGQATGPEGTAPGPGDATQQGVPHLGGAPGPATAAPQTPPSATQHPASPGGGPSDSITPGAPTPTPVPTPHAALTPGMHFTGFDSGGGGGMPGSAQAPNFAMPNTGGSHGSGGGAQTAGYLTAAAPRIAQLASAVGVPLTHNPDGTITSPNAVWAHLLQRESGGRNVPQGIKDANSGGNEAQGYFQITPGTWKSHGGEEFAPTPMAASAEDQAAVAARILQANPSGSDWGAGGPGRENAADLLAGLSGGPAGAPYEPANFPPAAAGDGMQQRWQAAIARGAIGPNGELAPGTAAGSEQGLQQNTIRGRRLISALFPELQNIGGVRQDSLKWHPQGLALDLMIPGQGGLNDPTTPAGKALGDQINGFIHQNMGALGSDYTMWQEANHYNHVHDNYLPSGYPADPNQQYFVPQGLNLGSGVDDSIVGGSSSRATSAALVSPGGGGQPSPSFPDLPNLNSMGVPHLSGPSMTPGPAAQPRVSNGENVSPQSNFAKQTVQNATSGMYGILGSLFGGPDVNPRNWEGILHQPDRPTSMQHSGGAAVQPVTHNIDNSINLHGTTLGDTSDLQQKLKEEQMSRFYSASGGLPMSGIGSP